MAGKWDSVMKSLVNDNPEDFVNWLIEDAQYQATVSPELISRNIHTDGLYKVTIADEPYLIHVEFQKRGDSLMARRLCEYNLLATWQYDMPVYSFVLYLTKDSPIAESPYQVLLADRIPVHLFRFWPIKLWELETEEVLEAGRPGLLPLVPLTRQGQHRDTIERVIQILYDEGRNPNAGQLALTYGLAALVMQDKEGQDWLQKRFAMLDEILEDSWAFKQLRQKALEEGLAQGIAQGVEQGREQGLEQGLEQGREQSLEEILYSFVKIRFPQLLSIAQAKRAQITDHTELQKLVIQVGTAHDENEARSFLS
jgi:predicted transposase YdaD